MCTVVSVLALFTTAESIMTALGFINCYYSNTVTETMFSIFWWTQDVLFEIMVTTDLPLISSIWIFHVLSLRSDIITIGDQLEETEKSKQFHNPDRIHNMFMDLVKSRS